MSPPSRSGFSNRASSSRSRGPAPKIVVKKEPSSPDMPNSRHRPRRLDLSSSHIVHSSGALTARPSGLSTGKDLHDRSMDVRERQRQIIEARQKHGGKGGPPDEESRQQDMSPFGRPLKTPNTSRRKGPPPGLTIAPPSHVQFANERVIQSAPINQSFTGLRNNLPPSRQLANGPSNLSQTSHIHHVPAQQTSNRLPPIADVFPEPLGTARHLYTNSPGTSSHSNQQPPLPSPGFPPPQHQQGPQTSRPREYKSAEEAVQTLSGGREELLPRIVHYGGHQPPTPPSPMPNKNASQAYPTSADLHRSGSSRRRGRDEYERDMGTPPLGRQQARSGTFWRAARLPGDPAQEKGGIHCSLCEGLGFVPFVIPGFGPLRRLLFDVTTVWSLLTARMEF
ncbi:hypothetical protein N0V90_011124 [Kalmusia sp. IMI 367209]|nr:hypothetical protein N0V90_011124 [Kalmusia sp. IMI 367209]